MLNWLTQGMFDIGGYVQEFIIVISFFIWLFFINKESNIKKHKKIYIKIFLFALIGALISQIILMFFQGNIITMIKTTPKIFKHIKSISDTKYILELLNRGVSITGGLFILTIIMFLKKDFRKFIFPTLYPFPIFASLTRLGCLSKGCCFGKVSDLPFAIIYPPASEASIYQYSHYHRASRFIESYPVHPTPVYITISMLILFIIVYIMKQKNLKHIIIIATVLFGYSFFNFFIEFLRVEPIVLLNMTMGQILDIFMGMFSIIL